MSSDDSDYDYNTEEPIHSWGNDRGASSGDVGRGTASGDADGGVASGDVGLIDLALQGIPRCCPCGGKIQPKVLPEESLDMNPGKRYFTCEYLQDGGRHCRQPWVRGVEGELEKITERIDEADAMIWQVRSLFETCDKLQREVTSLKKQVESLEKVVFPPA